MSHPRQKKRESRQHHDFRLRQWPAFLEGGTALMSKARRIEMPLSKEQVLKTAQLLNVSEDEFLSPWLCDNVICEGVDNILVAQRIKEALTKIKN